MTTLILSTSIPIAMCASLAYCLVRERRTHLKLSRWGIGHNKGAVPTFAQELKRPVEVVIFGKSLYIGCLSFEKAEVWVREYQRFFAETAAWLSDFDPGDNAKNSTAIQTLSHKLYNAVLNKRFKKAFMRLMKKTLLADCVLNPNRVTARKLAKWLNHYTLAEMLWTLYAYNHGGHIKKNYASLLQSLHQASSGICDIQSQSPWSKAQNIIESARSRLSGSRYGLEQHLNSSMTGKTENQNQSEARENEAG